MSSVADTIVAALRGAGVRFLFGMPGGGSNLDLLDAAERAALPFVLTATETAGALAAIAQAEITRCPAACLTTLGPGVASVVNGIACASLDRVPLVLFTDSYSAEGRDRFEHQRLDHRALLAPVTKWSATISAENADDVITEAIARAMAHPRGPVHVECAGDVLSRSVSPHVGARGFQPSVADAGRSPERLALHREEAGLLAGARRPLLLVGLGARRSSDSAAIREICGRFRVPAMVTYKAKGVVADDDPWFAGVFTNGAIEQPIIAQSDLLIGVGLDPVELIPRRWTHTQPIVNVVPAIVDERHVTFASQLVADVPTGLQIIAERLRASTWDLAVVRQMVVEQRNAVSLPGTGLTPHRVVQVVADRAAARARVTVDAGAHMLPATLLWPVSEPNGMLISNGLSTMGFALPAAIGAALLDRGPAKAGHHDSRPVVALTGDGGLLMCAGELVTAVRERVHVVVVVFNDAALSLIDIKQKQRTLPTAGVGIGPVNWCALAESVGMRAQSATTETALADALTDALQHHGPSLVDARIDPSGYAATLKAVRG